MDPGESFSTGLFKWDVPRGAMPLPPALNHRQLEGAATTLPEPPHAAAYSSLWARGRELLGHGSLEVLFQTYGIRYYTAEKIAEMGFTMNTLLHMKDEELDDMMNRLSRIFRWDLLVGERYGVKAAVRAERQRLEEEEESRRLDALSQEGGLSEEPAQQQSGGGSVVGRWTTRALPLTTTGKKQRVIKKKDGDNVKWRLMEGMKVMGGVVREDDENENGGGGRGGGGRQREHPFIVTEPGEVARGKKNGLDYLFHLFEQCREFLIQVQTIAKEKGEKCPTKVTNQVFRYAKNAGANYINKPKMRHYVHCYALHCLDEEVSNALRRAFKERRENVGAWRQACYQPLVCIAARQGWDIDSIFNAHPRLSIWYVPTKLRLLCHAEKPKNAVASSSTL